MISWLAAHISSPPPRLVITPRSDLLWSDPLVDQYDLNAREHQTVTYLSNRNRGCGYLYGYKAVTEFLVHHPNPPPPTPAS